MRSLPIPSSVTSRLSAPDIRHPDCGFPRPAFYCTPETKYKSADSRSQPFIQSCYNKPKTCYDKTEIS